MNRVLMVIGGVVLAFVLVGGGLFAGINMGKAQATDAQNAFFQSRGFDPNNLPAGGGAGAGGFGGAGGTGGITGAAGANRRGAAGTITKVDGNTITVTTAQSATLTVQITDSTPIMKQATGTKSDLTVGTSIVVVGDRSGNNIAAQTIQIGGAGGLFGGFGGGGGRRGTATPTP